MSLGGGAEGKGDRESQAGFTSSVERHAGLDLMTHFALVGRWVAVSL